MQTPAGSECRFFYGDYHRGKNNEECRLLDTHQLDWHPTLCSKCPVPETLLANGCENMEFTPKLIKPFLIGRAQVTVSVYCSKCKCDVGEPRVGCGQCHPLLNSFVIAADDSDPAN